LRWCQERRATLAWLVVILLALLLVNDMVRVWQVTNHHDLDVSLRAARRLVAGEDIYADSEAFKASLEAGTFSMKDDSVVWPYAYVPLSAILFIPATFLSYSIVQVGWWGFNIAALLLGSWLSLRAVGPATPGRMALGLLLLYRFEPAVITLRLGQIELLQFLLLAFALYALSRNWERRAGLALGLAAGIKLFPGALIALLIWRRRWCAAAWALGVALVTGIGSFAIVGFDALPAYLAFTSVYGIGGAFAAFPYNQSFNGFFSRNLIQNVFTPTLKGLDLPGVTRALTIAGDIIVGAVCAWLAWHREKWSTTPSGREQRGFALEFSLAIAALFLISPHAQVYVFVWALVPFIVLVTWLVEQPRPVWWGWVGAVVAYLLMGRPFVLYRPGLTRLVQSHYFFGALLLWGLLGAILIHRRSLAQAGGRTRSTGPALGFESTEA